MTGKSKEATDSGEAEVQGNVDAETEQGYRGTRVDETPLENYTAGSDKPTPETEAPKDSGS